MEPKRTTTTTTTTRTPKQKSNQCRRPSYQIRTTSSEQRHKHNTSKMMSVKHLIATAFVASVLMVAIVALVAESHYGKRTQYHEQGLHGPKSYKFGFTSNDYKNPQERHEVSDGYGHVKGWYSFVDANGKYQIVHYEAHPKYGFKVFDYKSKAYNNGKRHYNS